MRLASLLIVSLLAGCAITPETETDRTVLSHDVQITIALFKQADPSIKTFFANSHGYAVFPSIGKGGVIFGYAWGRGEVFELGKHVGYCSVAQGTFGAQIGGQGYRQVIFFERAEPLDKFRNGTFEFAGQASATAVTARAAADVDYTNGVAVFTMAGGGLMLEASIGGQQFDFEPVR